MYKHQDMMNRKRKTGIPLPVPRCGAAALLFCLSLIAGSTSAQDAGARTQTGGGLTQSDSWSAKMAATVMSAWKDSLPEGAVVKWNYDQGVVLRGMEGLWYNTGDGRYFRYIQHCMDRLVDKQ